MFGLQRQPRLQSMADSTKPCWCGTTLAGKDLVWWSCTTTHHHISCMRQPRVPSLALLQYLGILRKQASKHKAAFWKWSTIEIGYMHDYTCMLYDNWFYAQWNCILPHQNLPLAGKCVVLFLISCTCQSTEAGIFWMEWIIWRQWVLWIQAGFY